jgi:hypothetical protein
MMLHFTHDGSCFNDIFRLETEHHGVAISDEGLFNLEIGSENITASDGIMSRKIVHSFKLYFKK